MLDLIKNMFSAGPKADFAELIANKAIILDVRSPGEFNSGHIKGAINLPLNNLQSSMGKLKKDKVYITCCASGMRSASAKSLLKSSGFENVHNGGSWMILNTFVK